MVIAVKIMMSSKIMMKYDSNDGKNNSCDHNDYFGNYCANNNNGYG